MPPLTFFEGLQGVSSEPPFVSLEGNEWEKCLSLKDGQTNDFFVTTQNIHGSPEQFVFSAACGILQFPVELPIISCSVARIDPYSHHTFAGRIGSIENYASFLAIAQHDLDAPLRKVSMLTDLLDTKFIAGKIPAASDYMVKIRGGLSSMHSMLDSLGKLVEKPDPEMKSGPCDLEAIAADVKKQLAVTFGSETGMAIGTLPVVPGRREELRELIFQVLYNAALFHPEDVSATVAITEEALTGDECRSRGLKPGRKFHKIVIEDGGIGIPSDHLEAIFDPFVRLNGKSEYPGNGLGLSLCKRIARGHGGDIYADGNVSNGSRFILILPAFIN